MPEEAIKTNIKSEPTNSENDSHSIANRKDSDNIHPLVKQLFAIGYEIGDTVTGRNISPIGKKNNDWRGTLTETNIEIQRGTWNSGIFTYNGEHYKDGLSWLEEQNIERGIYFNVNGGRDNKSVKRFYASFFEHDKGTHKEQQELIDLFPIKPTAIVRTKRSSHTYYRITCENLEEYGKLENWSSRQEKIAYAMASDPAVKDKPRLMRGAGFDHIKEAEFSYDGGEFDYVPCILQVCEPDRRYTLDEIDNAIDEFCLQQGIKPFSKERFAGYQYIISKLNQKKRGVDYSHPKFNPDIFRYCDDSDLSELTIRAKNFARLREKQHFGKECADPETAWKDPIEKVKERYQRDFEFNTVSVSDEIKRQAGLLSDEELTEYFAREYGTGYSEAGTPGARQNWHTCQCPSHGSSTNSTDNLHINSSDPNYKKGTLRCQSGCDFKDILLAFRQRAQDANDPLWNAHYGKEKQNNKTKTPEQLAKESAQLETEKIAHKQLSLIDYDKLQQLGIVIRKVNKAKLSPDDFNIEKGKILIVISEKGTGKTEGLQSIAPSYDAIYSWHTRITLAIKMAGDLEKFGMVYKDEAEKNQFIKKISFCANSAHRFHPKNLRSKGLLLFDEMDQVLQYLSDSLCNNDGIRPYLLAMHKAQLETALLDGSALYMSADIAQKEIDNILAIAPKDAKIEILINEYRPTKGKLQFSIDPTPDALVSKLLQNLDNGIPTFLLDDFKNGFRGCRTVAEYVRKKKPELANQIVEINGDTSELPEIKAYIKDINVESEKQNTLLLSCSPSVISGVSLQNGRFNKSVFGIINGILTPNNGSQGIARVRGAENIYVWVAPHGFNYERSGGITPEDVNNYYQSNYNKRNNLLHTYCPNYNPMTEEWESPNWKLFCQNSAINNIEMRQLRYWYKEKLDADGYQLEEKEFGIDPNTEDFLKDIWGQLQLADVKEIAQSKDITKTEADALRHKSQAGENLSKEERLQAIKFHLRDTFGDELIATAKEFHNQSKQELKGIEAIALMNWGSRFEKRLFRHYRNFHQPIDKVAASDLYMEQKQTSLRPDFEGANKRFPKDIEWKLREYKLWEYLEFKQYLDPSRSYYPDDYKPLIEKVRSKVEEIQQVTGYNFAEASDGQVISYLYASLALDTERKKVTVDGKRIYVKKITQQSWEFTQKFIAHQIGKREFLAECPDPPVFYSNGSLNRGSGQYLESLISKGSIDFQAILSIKPSPGDDTPIKTLQMTKLFEELSKLMPCHRIPSSPNLILIGLEDGYISGIKADGSGVHFHWTAKTV